MSGTRLASRVSVAMLVVLLAACSSGSGDSGKAPEDQVSSSAEGVDPLPRLPDDVALPIVFVHGFAGSAQQYESQSLRFAANGYPLERILAYDHDGAGFDIAGYATGVDEVVDDALAEFGVEHLYLVGHSRGTMVSSLYLRDPARAAKVAKYVAIDGAACPETVPCLAPTQRILPGQAHVEVATSKESFALQYEFLVGEAPEVLDIVPQREPVELSGRAVNFPANTGRAGATLQVWRVDPDTGARTGGKPHASFELGESGDFGPLEVESGAHYEYVLSAPGSPIRHHLYLQPSPRSSRLTRLLSSPPDGSTRTNSNVDADHASIIAIRMREWYAGDDPDLDGDQRDVLQVGTGGGPPVDVLAEFVGNRAIGLHLHDDAVTPGESTLAPLPYFSTQPFQSGVDVFMPVSGDAGKTIRVTNIPRGATDRPQTLNVRDWPSDRHSISVVFTDYPVDVSAQDRQR